MIDVLNPNGKHKQSNLYQEKSNNTYAIHIVIAYATLVLFPKNSPKILKLMTLLLFVASFLFDIVFYDLVEGFETAQYRDFTLNELAKCSRTSHFTIFQLSLICKRLAIFFSVTVLTVAMVLYQNPVDKAYIGLEKIKEEYMVIGIKNKYDIVKRLQKISGELEKQVSDFRSLLSKNILYIKVSLGGLSIASCLLIYIMVVEGWHRKEMEEGVKP